MVHPNYRRRGIFSKLFALVRSEITKQNYKKILLLTDHHSKSGQGFIEHTNSTLDHSEYEMILNKDTNQVESTNLLTFRKAKNNDAREIQVQNSIYFNQDFIEDLNYNPEEEERYGSITYLAVLNQIIVGKVRLEVNEGIGGIFGLGVLPDFRKKGYGREIIKFSINKLKQMNVKEIKLQVLTNNKNALNLYKSCGFEEVSSMDYYEYKIE